MKCQARKRQREHRHRTLFLQRHCAMVHAGPTRLRGMSMIACTASHLDIRRALRRIEMRIGKWMIVCGQRCGRCALGCLSLSRGAGFQWEPGPTSPHAYRETCVMFACNWHEIRMVSGHASYASNGDETVAPHRYAAWMYSIDSSLGIRHT
jgi:hypothetical protein